MAALLATAIGAPVPAQDVTAQGFVPVPAAVIPDECRDERGLVRAGLDGGAPSFNRLNSRARAITLEDFRKIKYPLGSTPEKRPSVVAKDRRVGQETTIFQIDGVEVRGHSGCAGRVSFQLGKLGRYTEPDDVPFEGGIALKNCRDRSKYKEAINVWLNNYMVNVSVWHGLIDMDADCYSAGEGTPPLRVIGVGYWEDVRGVSEPRLTLNPILSIQALDPNSGEPIPIDENLPIPTADRPRSGKARVSVTAEKGVTKLPSGKTFTLSNTDSTWESFLRSPSVEGSDFGGNQPNVMQVRLTANSETAAGGLQDIMFNLRFPSASGIQDGSYTYSLKGTDEVGPKFELQINLSFCTGGIQSTYTIDDFEFDCEYARGSTGGIIVVPHLKKLNLTYTTKCGDDIGSMRGTISIDDKPAFDCASIAPVPSGGTGGGGTGGGTGGGGTGGGDTGGGTGDTPTTPANAPRVIVPDDIRNDGVQLNNLQSAKVTLQTSVPSGFDADVELGAFSQPEGLVLSLSPTAIAAPGTGASLLTISAGPDTRAGDYTVVISATGNGITSFNVIKVSVICDPPMIFGLDQPSNTSINGGNSTTIEVKPAGSGPFTYQWYAGHTGGTATPIAGAIDRTFNTGALTSTSDYWVRVTNPCGSVDSNTVTVTVH